MRCWLGSSEQEGGFSEKIKLITDGIADENIVTMCLIFLVAVRFQRQLIWRGAESAVHLGLSIMPANVAVVGLFVIAALSPCRWGIDGDDRGDGADCNRISTKAGIALPVCVSRRSHVRCHVRDVSVISRRSRYDDRCCAHAGCEMKDKFRENFLIVLPAAITAVLFFLSGRRRSVI